MSESFSFKDSKTVNHLKSYSLLVKIYEFFISLSVVTKLLSLVKKSTSTIKNFSIKFTTAEETASESVQENLTRLDAFIDKSILGKLDTVASDKTKNMSLSVLNSKFESSIASYLKLDEKDESFKSIKEQSEGNELIRMFKLIELVFDKKLPNSKQNVEKPLNYLYDKIASNVNSSNSYFENAYIVSKTVVDDALKYLSTNYPSLDKKFDIPSLGKFSVSVESSKDKVDSSVAEALDGADKAVSSGTDFTN